MARRFCDKISHKHIYQNFEKMKKTYIIPNAKFIDLASEGALLADSLNNGEGQVDSGEGSSEDSNRRTSIWGDNQW